jgi:hypothetical protein
MNKKKLLYLSSVAVIGIVSSVAIAQNNNVVQPAPQAPIPPVAQAPVPKPVQPPVVNPVAPAPVVQAPSQPAQKPPASEPIAPKPQPQELTPAQRDPSLIPEGLRESLQNDFKDALDFPLTEEKIIAYVRAAKKVERINSRWDVEIAAAETDIMAMENTNFAIEDITAALKNMQDLTMVEYNALTLLTINNNDFARVVSVYQQLVGQGVFGVAKRPVTQNAAANITAVLPASAGLSTPAPTPTVSPANAVPSNQMSKPVSGQAPMPQTAPAPAGSPTPPYSQPPVR